MSVRPDLEAKAAKASTRKIPLHMASDERHRLMDVLLQISRIAGEAFDVLDADRISEADVFVLLQLPDWCNEFTKGIERHAQARVVGNS